MKAILAMLVALGGAAWAAKPAARHDQSARQAGADAAAKPAADKGAAAQPRQALQMVYRGGWGAGVLRDLRVSGDGQFGYVHRRVNKSDGTSTAIRLAGRLPEAKLKELLAAVAGAGEGPEAEDAGHILFEWTDEAGKRRSRSYTHPREGPCAELLDLVDGLARRYGRTPGQPPASRPAALTAEQARAAAALIAQLGAADLKTREAATEKLKAIGEQVRDLLEARAKQPGLDPELAARLEAVLKALDRPEAAQATAADIQVARNWCDALLAGKVDDVLAASDVPFSWDRKEQVATAEALLDRFRQVVRRKGQRDIRAAGAEAVAPGEAAGALDKHRELGGRGGRLALVKVVLQRDAVLVIVRQGEQPKVVGFSD